jgi:hypothetical protein
MSFLVFIAATLLLNMPALAEPYFDWTVFKIKAPLLSFKGVHHSVQNEVACQRNETETVESEDIVWYDSMVHLLV